MTISMTRVQLEAARSRLQQQGVSIVGDEGAVSHEGVTINFSFAEPVFTCSIAHKPFIVPASVIESKITGWFAQQ